MAASEARQRWFAQILKAGLEESIFGPAHLMSHLTPELLAEHLPAEVMSRVLSTALQSGTMTPEGILASATPEVLSQHLPHDVLWACVTEAAERAGLSQTDKSG